MSPQAKAGKASAVPSVVGDAPSGGNHPGANAPSNELKLDPHTGQRKILDNRREAEEKRPFFRFKQQEDGARALLIRRNYQTAPQAWTDT